MADKATTLEELNEVNKGRDFKDRWLRRDLLERLYGKEADCMYMVAAGTFTTGRARWRWTALKNGEVLSRRPALYMPSGECFVSTQEWTQPPARYEVTTDDVLEAG